MTPLLLIPGMMCDARMWGGLPAALAPRIVHHAPPMVAEDMSEIAAQVLATAPETFALAGLSMGGIVAMEIVRQAGHRVERLALLDTNPLAEPDDIRARRQPQIDRALAGDLKSVIRDEMKPNYLANPDDAVLLNLCMDMALGLGPEVFCSQSRALRERRDQTAILAGYFRPALVLMGEHDRPCPRARHDLMHRLMPQSRLKIVAGAGHLPPLEQPEETLLAFRKWLDE